MHPSPAFSIIEALIVLALLFVLAALMVPHLSGSRKITLESACHAREADLTSGVYQYYYDYNQWPLSSNAVYATTNGDQGTNDFTCGTYVQGVPGAPEHGDVFVTNVTTIRNLHAIGNPTSYQNLNSEVTSILIDAPCWPESNSLGNMHRYNQRGERYISDLAGLDTNFVMRNPWGSPYILTIDVNGDQRCWDPVYSQLTGKTIPERVIAWSLGPNKDLDVSTGATPNYFANKFHVLSWRDSY